MVIFHSYVSLPEGTIHVHPTFIQLIHGVPVLDLVIWWLGPSPAAISMAQRAFTGRVWPMRWARWMA